MLAAIGFITVIAMLVLIMTKKLTPTVALILVPFIAGIIAMPASLLFDPDSFYYGVLPVLMETGSSFGVTNLDIARAAIAGQMTLGFPVSPLTPATFLLMGLAGVELGEHQKHTLPWAWLVSIVILVVAIVVGAITI